MTYLAIALAREILMAGERDRAALERSIKDRDEMLARIHALPMVRYADRPDDGYGRCVP